MMKIIFIILVSISFVWCSFSEKIVSDTERTEIIGKLEKDSSLFEHLPEYIRNDRKIAEVAIKKDPENLWHINSKIRQDKDFLLSITSWLDDFKVIPNIPTEYLNDEEFVFSLIEKQVVFASFIPPQHLQNQNFVNKILQMKSPPTYFIDYIPKDLKDSREELINIINTASKEDIERIFLSFTPIFFDDTELVKSVLLKNPLAYKYLDGRLKNNKDLSLIAIKGDSYNFQYLPWKFRTDKDFINLVNPKRFEIKEEVTDESIIIKDIDYIAYASEEIRSSKDLFLKLLKIEDNYYFEDMISSASEDLRADKDFALKAVSINWRTLAYFDSKIRSDKDVVFSAIGNNVTVLWEASPELKADKEFILSLSKDSDSQAFFYWKTSYFSHIDPILRWDLDVAIKWAEIDPLSIFEISPDLRSNPKFTNVYIENFPENMRYLPYITRLVYKSLEGCLLRVKYRDTDKVDICSDDFEKSEKKWDLVKWLWYDDKNKYLIIQLDDTNYHYCDFKSSDWKTIKSSKDIDAFYKSDIQWKYDCRSGIAPKY